MRPDHHCNVCMFMRGCTVMSVNKVSLRSQGQREALCLKSLATCEMVRMDSNFLLCISISGTFPNLKADHPDFNPRKTLKEKLQIVLDCSEAEISRVGQAVGCNLAVHLLKGEGCKTVALSKSKPKCENNLLCYTSDHQRHFETAPAGANQV